MSGSSSARSSGVKGGSALYRMSLTPRRTAGRLEIGHGRRVTMCGPSPLGDSAEALEAGTFGRIENGVVRPGGAVAPWGSRSALADRVADQALLAFWRTPSSTLTTRSARASWARAADIWLEVSSPPVAAMSRLSIEFASP